MVALRLAETWMSKIDEQWVSKIDGWWMSKNTRSYEKRRKWPKNWRDWPNHCQSAQLVSGSLFLAHYF